MLVTDTGGKWHAENVVPAEFHTDKTVDDILVETEKIFTSEFEGGDRHRAMKRLRVPPLGKDEMQWPIFGVGVFLGMFSILLLDTILLPAFQFDIPNPVNLADCKSEDSESCEEQPNLNCTGLVDCIEITRAVNCTEQHHFNWNIFLRLYRGPFWIDIFIFLFGLNLAGWRKSGINHVLIFELDPRNSFTGRHLFALAAILGSMWCVSVLGFFYGKVIGVPPFVFPLVLVCTKIMFLFVPLPMFRSTQAWIWKVVGRTCAAPFCKVNFADFWMADQLMSLSRAMADTDNFILLYATTKWYDLDSGHCEYHVKNVWWVNLTLLCLPPWFRFAQCIRRYWDSREKFPHLANALKYATTFGVTITSTLYGLHDSDVLLALWLVFLLFSSIYGLVWDIKMDWGLISWEKGELKLLREDLLLGSPWVYYAAIAQDFLLRFGWAVSISLSETRLLQSEVITTIFGTLEILRRFFWNFLRLENEHLNNCGKFRAVRDISIKALTIDKHGEMVAMSEIELTRV